MTFCVIFPLTQVIVFLALGVVDGVADGEGVGVGVGVALTVGVGEGVGVGVGLGVGTTTGTGLRGGPAHQLVNKPDSGTVAAAG